MYFINHVVLTQNELQKGLQVFDIRGVAAIQKEMKQYRNLGVISSNNGETITKQQKSRALSYLKRTDVTMSKAMVVPTNTNNDYGCRKNRHPPL